MNAHKLRASSKYNIAYTARISSATDASTYTFNSVDFGTADNMREVYVVFSYSASTTRTVSSVTIGGVTATAVVASAFTTTGTAMYMAKVPTGATGTIVINTSGNLTRIGGGVFISIGRTNYGAQETASDIGAVPTSVTSRNISLTIPNNGFAIGLFATSVGNPGTFSSSFFDVVDSYSFTDGAVTSYQSLYLYKNMRQSQNTQTKTISWTIARGYLSTTCAFN